MYVTHCQYTKCNNDTHVVILPIQHAGYIYVHQGYFYIFVLGTQIVLKNNIQSTLKKALQ